MPVDGLSLGDAIQWGGAEKIAPGKPRGFRGPSTGPYVGGVGRFTSYAITSTEGAVDATSGSTWTDTAQRAAVTRRAAGEDELRAHLHRRRTAGHVEPRQRARAERGPGGRRRRPALVARRRRDERRRSERCPRVGTGRRRCGAHDDPRRRDAAPARRALAAGVVRPRLFAVGEDAPVSIGRRSRSWPAERPTPTWRSRGRPGSTLSAWALLMRPSLAGRASPARSPSSAPTGRRSPTSGRQTPPAPRAIRRRPRTAWSTSRSPGASTA